MTRSMDGSWLRRMVLAAALAGCGGPTGGGADGGSTDAGSAADAGASDAGDARDAGTPPGPRVFVHLTATHAEVTHAPGSAGQTPRDWVSGIRSLHLLRSMDDPAPFLVFSHGDGFVEASYADGADTVVGERPIAELERGTYAWARVVHTHVRFTLDATLHAGFGPMPGVLEDEIVLSDRTTLDGATYAQGDYFTNFLYAGMSFPSRGSGYTVPAIAGGGFSARVEDGETVYYFPAPLVVDDTLTEDVHLIFEVNVHEGFRWTDQPTADYAEGVFDITAVGTEPIVQAGANGYTYTVR